MAGVVRLGVDFIEEDHHALTTRPCHWKMDRTKFKAGEVEESKKYGANYSEINFAMAIRFVSFARGVSRFCFSIPLNRTRTPLFSKEWLNKGQRKERQRSWRRRKKTSNDARTSAGHEERKKGKRKRRANGRKRRSEGRGDDSNLSAKAQGRTGPQRFARVHVPRVGTCTEQRGTQTRTGRGTCTLHRHS